MDDSLRLALWLAAWLAAAAVILYSRGKRGAVGSGLVLAYLVNLWLLHWPAAATYLLPWYWYFNLDVVEAGFQQSTYAVIAFAVGSVLVAPLLLRGFRFPARAAPRAPEPRLAKVYMVVGLACYLILVRLAESFATITALLAAGWNLLVVGLALASWEAWQRGRRGASLGWLVVAACLPFFTIVAQGFLWYGAAAFLSVFSFFVTFYRPRWKLVLMACLIAYLGTSLYVTYMRDRLAIRDVVWRDQPLVDRLEVVYLTLSNPEWFNAPNVAHLQAIDLRLNQNLLVGAAVHYQRARLQDFAHGETLWLALVALVPRVVWPGKPAVAGSEDLVTKYTGIPFVQGTSVGIGQVMEFYINFGVVGVVLGFLILGVIVRVVDSAAGHRLVKGDWQGFTLWYLPGLALLQVGGSLVELTSSAGAAIATALLVNRFVLHGLRGRKLLGDPEPRVSGGGVG